MNRTQRRMLEERLEKLQREQKHDLFWGILSLVLLALPLGFLLWIIIIVAIYWEHSKRKDKIEDLEFKLAGGRKPKGRRKKD